MKMIPSSLFRHRSYIPGIRQLSTTTTRRELLVVVNNDYEVMKRIITNQEQQQPLLLTKNNHHATISSSLLPPLFLRFHNNDIIKINTNTKYNHTLKRSMVMITKTKADENMISPTSPPTPLKSSAATDSAPSSISSSVSMDSYKVDAPTTSTSNNSDEEQQKNYSLIITDSCWERIRQLAQRKNMEVHELYLRVYVDAGGCSGFSYKFESENNETLNLTEDIIFTHVQTGARIVVDLGSYEFLQNATIDYTIEMIKSTFEVKNNPQSESACGCGSSFALKNFQSNPALD